MLRFMMSRDWKITVKIVVGILSVLAISVILPSSVEARNYYIRASDGGLYTVRLGENPNVDNFSVQKSNGEILRGVTEAERVIAAELYFAAKLLWHVIPRYSPEAPVKDFEGWVTGKAILGIIKLLTKQGLDILTNGFVNGFTGAVQLLLKGDLASIVEGWIPGAINNAIADEAENRLLIDAANLAKSMAMEAVVRENMLRDFWLSYETRSTIISMDNINAAWESYYTVIEYKSLATNLVYKYLQDPESDISLGTGGLGSIGLSLLPAGTKVKKVVQGVVTTLEITEEVIGVVETARSIHYTQKHIEHLRHIRENAKSAIHQQVLSYINAQKRQSRVTLDQTGYFQPMTVRSPATPIFTPPTTIYTSLERVKKGDTVITQLSTGSTLAVRPDASTDNIPEEVIGNGVTGTITDGPRSNEGFRWWYIKWDIPGLDLVGWSVEYDRGQVLFRYPPDLEIQRLEVSNDQVGPGDRFEVEVTVRNNGPGYSNATKVYVYYSLDRHLNLEDFSKANDLQGGWEIDVPSLREGRSRDVSLSVEAPMIQGRYYYGAILPHKDYNLDLGLDFYNNDLAYQERVEVISAPDLIVEFIAANSINLVPSDFFTLSVIVQNKGTGPSESTTLRYYGASGDQVGTARIGRLSPSGTYEQSILLNAPDEMGKYYFKACVDDVRGESNTDNNCSVPFTITIRSPANRAPVAIGAIPPRVLTLDNLSESVEVSGNFSDPDGDFLSYTARSDNISVATTNVSGSQVTIVPQGIGSATVTVTARDGELTVIQDFTVTVTGDQNHLPTVQDICHRTSQVRDKILDRMDIADCADVTSVDLDSITRLRISKAEITVVKKNDFQGLTSLGDLDLSDNSLTSLPVGVFDGLSALFYLDLYNNTLSSLPVSVFNDLNMLEDLDLGGNSLTSLPVGVFDGLSALEILELDNNSLTSLPVGVFDELSSLKKLDLKDNGLSSLPVGVFDGLSALEILELDNNSLTSLPVGIFDGLSSLTHLELDSNSLTSLPVGVFDGLDALETLDLDSNQLITLPAGIFDDVLDTLKASYVDLDDSLKATFGFSTTAQDVAEGKTVRVEINLSRSLPVAVRVPYTVGGTATADDYANLQPPTELLFLAGETSKEIVFTLLEDADTTAETVSLTLSKMDDVKFRKSDGSGPDAKLYADILLTAPQQRFHTITVTAGGEGISRLMYWAGGDNKIYRSKLDGTQVQVLFEGGDPRSLALDISSGKMYWADHNPGRIRRANLDGSGVVDLVTDVGSPLGFALDVSGGKMYWLDYQFDKIQRANLNGSGIEDLVPGLDKPLSIALDVSGGKMYWTDTGTDAIHRANLDGTNVEELIDGFSRPSGIALDISSGKMYWIDSGMDKIYRANLDGTNVEDLVVDIKIGADSLALDISRGKMYWADNEEDKICRANLDGSQIEELYSGGYPIAIALAVGSVIAANAAPSVVRTNSALTLSTETALLSNYPNPFNPETWIPYQLAEPADVTVTIYDINGSVVRALALGHQSVGVYHSQARAAYWDGRNEQGERVASGVYFYTLTAGDFTATRKMLIRK